MTAKKIQDVALKYFSLKGYDGTSLAEIAEEVGIKKPSIYAHFKSKNELFLAVAQDVADRYYEHWQELLVATENFDYEQRLYEIFRSIVAYFSNDRIKVAFWVRVLMFPPPEDKDNLLLIFKERVKDLLEQITQIFEQGIKDGAIHNGIAKNMAYAYFCLLDGYLMRAICSDNEEYEQQAAQIWENFWYGIKR